MLLGWGRASLGWHRGTAWAGADKSQWVDGSSLGWWSGMSGAGRGEQSESLSAWQAGQEQGSFPAPGSLSCLLPVPHGHCTMCSFVERRKRFFWSGSLACQQNRIHGRPVPSTPFSSCPSHIISKNWKSRGEPRGGLQNLHSQLGRTGEGGGKRCQHSRESLRGTQRSWALAEAAAFLLDALLSRGKPQKALVPDEVSRISPSGQSPRQGRVVNAACGCSLSDG